MTNAVNKSVMASVKDYLRHYGYTEHARSADYSYSLFSRDYDFMGKHTHVTIEVRVSNSEIMYQVGAILPCSGMIKLEAPKTTNASLVWLQATKLHNMVRRCASVDDNMTQSDCEELWRVPSNG